MRRVASDARYTDARVDFRLELRKIEEFLYQPQTSGRLTLTSARAERMIEINDMSAFPAGLPMLEVIRKLEQEKLLTREERAIVNDMTRDATKRELLFKCLKDVEIGSSTKFAVRRLKALLYNNGGGMPLKGSVLEPLPSIDAAEVRLPRDRGSRREASHAEAEDTAKAISKAFGDGSVVEGEPCEVLYAHPDNYNVCTKILRRLANVQQGMRPLKYAVLIGSGSFNPLTRMHLRRYYVAKQWLETGALGLTVLGCLLSPSHATTVRERYKTNSCEILPSPHRLAMAQMLVEESNFISVDPWEITRRRPMDIMSLLEHTSEMLRTQLQGADVRVLCLCKGNAVPKLSPQLLREGGFSIVCVTRPPETDALRLSIGSRWNGVLHIVEDAAVIDASLDVVSSKKVRERLRAGDAVTHLVGQRIAQYCSDQRLGAKMRSDEDWTTEEKALPRIVSRSQQRDDAHLHSQHGRLVPRTLSGPSLDVKP